MKRLFNLCPIGNFVPTSLSGCILWLDANDLSTITKDGSNLVSQWNDKSTAGNNAVQATGAKQPLWTTNTLNGKAIVDFQNKTMTFGGVQFLNSTRGHSIIFVQKITAFKTGNNFFCSNTNLAGKPCFAYKNSKSTLQMVNGLSFGYFEFAQSTNTSAFHTLQYDYNGAGVGNANTANFTLYYDKGSAVTASVDSLGAGDGSVTVLGGYADVSDANFNGFNQVATMIVYNRQLATSERTLLNNWITKQYAI